MTPMPGIVSVSVGLMAIVNALAPALNTIPSTCVLADIETLVILEETNVAVSAAPLGTTMGVQFAALFQFPLPGLRFHVALPA